MLSSISASSTSVQATPLKAPDAAQVFKQLDQDNKGYLTESDLASALVSISPEGAKRSESDADTMAKDAFAKMDGDGDGQVTQSEFEAAAPPANAPDAASAGSPQAAGGAAPTGGGGGAHGAAGASSSETTYDPADTNEDGTVSEQERLIYEAKQATAKAQEAIDTYEAVANAA